MGAAGLGATDAQAQIPIGRATNISDAIHHEARPVMANAAAQTVVFIHPQDVTFWGGGSSANGRLRYDASTDGGRTFRSDIGPLQAEYRSRTRHPSGLLVPGADALRLTWIAASDRAPTPGWVDHVSGTCVLAIDAAPISTEHYQFAADADTAAIPGSLAPGAPGVFWSVGVEDPAVDGTGALTVYRGDYSANAGDVVWSQAHQLLPPYRAGTASPGLWSPRVAFEPLGRRGWVSFLADLTDIPEQTWGRRPVFWHTTDGGRTFENLRSIDLRLVPLVSRGGTEEDVVARLRAEGALSPEPTVTFQSDLTVDANGNPHLVMGLAAATPFDGLRADTTTLHLLVDLTSSDGGRSWRMYEIAPLRTHRGSLGDFEPVIFGNEPHIARDASGEHVFFSWIDSNSVNLGPDPLPANLEPDLNVAALNVADHRRTAPRNVTELDLLWNGRVHLPRMATEVLERDGQWQLPVVAVELLTNDPTQPVQFYYFGGQATVPLDAFGGIDPPDPDAGVEDAGPEDAEVADSAVIDAEMVADLGVVDFNVADAAAEDAVAVDATSADATRADAAQQDQRVADPDADAPRADATTQPDGATTGGGKGGGGGCQAVTTNPSTSLGIWALGLLGLVRRRRRA